MVVRFEKPRRESGKEESAARPRPLEPARRPLTLREIAHREQMLRFLRSRAAS